MRPIFRQFAYMAYIAGLSLIALSLTAHLAYAQSKDAFLGKWVMDPDHSQFTPGPGPFDRSMIFEMKNGSLHNLTSTRTANGGITTIEYTAKFDGHDYPIDGTGLDTVSIKRDDPNTIDRTGKVRGMPSETCLMKIAPDGKTLTMTVKGAYNGANYASTQIYRRQ
jgi:hypothetical protein